MDNQQKQHILDLPKVIAGGIASPSAALLTSRFGVAGTIVGLAVSAMVITVISDVLKVYLARAPGAVTTIPGGLRKKPRWQRPLHRLRLPFSKFSSLAPARRRSILIRSLIAGVLMFVIGLVVVTGLEVGVGNNLSCWVWNNCSAETSAGGSSASNTSTGTLPSILGGGRSTGSSPLQGSPVSPPPAQQQPPSAPSGSPEPTQSGASGQQPSSSPQTPAQQQNSSGGYQQESEQSSSSSSQQQSPSGEYPQQQGSSSEYQQQGPSGSTEYTQQSPLGSSEITTQQASS